MSEHAQQLGFSRQAIRRLTAEMQQDGLVSLVADPADKRALRLVLTDAGRRLQQEALARGLAYNLGISAGVTPQALADALDTVTRLTTAMTDLERGGD